jgi:hypothetical protein
MVKATSMVGKNRKSRLDLPFTESFVNYLNDECRICKLASTVDRLFSLIHNHKYRLRNLLDPDKYPGTYE